MNVGVAPTDLPHLIGADSIELVGSPTELSGHIIGVSMFDRADEGDLRDHLVLLNGIGGLSQISEAVLGMSKRNVLAVVIDPQTPDDTESISNLAQRCGVAILSRRERLSWLVLADVLRAALMSEPDVDDRVDSGVAVGDLTALAETLAEMLGGPVIIEDAKFRVLSYSTSTGHIDHGRDIAILGRRIPDEWLAYLASLGVIDTLLTSDEVLTIEGGPFQARRRYLCSIRSDRFLLGILWLADADGPVPGDVVDRMSVAARIAAPHLFRRHEESFGQHSAKLKALRSLLESGHVTRSAAEELGVAPARDYTLFGLRCTDDGILNNLDKSRVVQSIGLYCQSYRWRAATIAIGHTVYCLVAHDSDLDFDRLANFGAGIAENTRRVLLGRLVRVALSERSEELRSIPVLRDQVDQVLDIPLAAEESGTVLRYGSVIPRIVIARVVDELARERVAYPKLDVLAEQDAVSGTEYIRTIRAYLTAFGKATVAAESLQLHVTTLRHRLRRILAVSGLDLNDPDERLLCELMLRRGDPTTSSDQRDFPRLLGG